MHVTYFNIRSKEGRGLREDEVTLLSQQWCKNCTRLSTPNLGDYYLDLILYYLHRNVFVKII